MTRRAQTTIGARFRPGRGLVTAAAFVLGAAACDRDNGTAQAPADDPPRQETGARPAENGVSTVTIRRPATDADRQTAAQTTDAPPQPAAGPQDAGGAPQPAPTAGDVSQQAAANVETTVELGAFSPTTPPSSGDAEGRLPAPGDLTIYVPNVTLFPGSARLDPGIENPYSGNEAAIAAGERHFNAFNCSGCHAPLGGGGMGPPLTDDQWIHGSGPAQIYLTIMHGRPEGMPAFGSMLPQRTVWEMVAYIETLSEIDNYATHLGFDAEHATTTDLPSRRAATAPSEPRAARQ